MYNALENHLIIINIIYIYNTYLVEYYILTWNIYVNVYNI